MANHEYLIGIDVGTGSVRGALVDTKGKIRRTQLSPIKTWNPDHNFYQQSSDDIWHACCDVIQNLTTDVPPSSIKGIGVDATCSLAVFDIDGQPVSVQPDGDDEQNIILWMDHRARDQAEFINKTEHSLLKYVGGKISPEMVVPKLLWLKRNNEKCWNRAQRYFLLSDFLTWKLTGVEDRSLCSVVCKCNYENRPNRCGWNRQFFDTVQLGELCENNWQKLGSKIINPGDFAGALTMQAAQQLNLPPGLPVGASLIDAHAGGLGIMGCVAPNLSPKFETRLGLICGTSTCHMLQTRDKLFVAGMWGPFYSAILPGMWLLTGGQSASGALIDHIIDAHPATVSIKAKIGNSIRLTTYLNNTLNAMRQKNNLPCVDELTKHIHVWPDFHGNRSPLGDPNLRGMICGLSLSKDEESLALLYLATIQALAYGTKHILRAIESSAGKRVVESVVLCGGLSQNEQFVQTYANVLELPVLVPENHESMLLGAAQLGATAAGIYKNLQQSMLNMGGLARQIEPCEGVSSFHGKKYDVFLELLSTQYKCRDIMNANV